jgi:hypothetical protein
MSKETEEDMSKPRIGTGYCPKCKVTRDIVVRRSVEQCRICYFPYDEEKWHV